MNQFALFTSEHRVDYTVVVLHRAEEGFAIDKRNRLASRSCRGALSHYQRIFAVTD